jgi:hypothetical protein
VTVPLRVDVKLRREPATDPIDSAHGERIAIDRQEQVLVAIEHRIRATARDERMRYF